jgi:hypothetical protein
MTTDFDFDHIVPTEIPVKIGGKKYVLREAGSDAAIKFRDAVMAATTWVPGIDGKPENRIARVEKMADTEILLVALCLFPANADGQLAKDENGSPTAAPVGMSFVRNLLDRIRQPLYDKIKEISPTLADDTEASLAKEMENLKRRTERFHKNGVPEDQAKNLSDATTTTSS